MTCHSRCATRSTFCTLVLHCAQLGSQVEPPIWSEGEAQCRPAIDKQPARQALCARQLVRTFSPLSHSYRFFTFFVLVSFHSLWNSIIGEKRTQKEIIFCDSAHLTRVLWANLFFMPSFFAVPNFWVTQNVWIEADSCFLHHITITRLRKCTAVGMRMHSMRLNARIVTTFLQCSQFFSCLHSRIASLSRFESRARVRPREVHF